MEVQKSLSHKEFIDSMTHFGVWYCFLKEVETI